MSSGENKANGAEEVAAQAAEEILGPNPFIGLRPQDILATVGTISAQAIKQPVLLLEQEAALVRDLIWVLLGDTVVKPAQSDRRFSDTAWKENPFYRIYQQGYLVWANTLSNFVNRSGLDDISKKRAHFVIELLTDALAPTNTLLGNPAALKKVIESGGTSVVSGLKNLVGDLVSNQGMPAQVDKSAFELGKNLALSPGAVVFCDNVLELIQYTPTTPEVHVRPQMIVPPQINKFYLFDISPGKSVIEFLVKSGFQVFVVSWRNPTSAQRNWDMDTYVASLLEAMAAVRDITGSEDVNLHGACSGAMTMSALLGYLAATGQNLVQAATLMVAVLDGGAGSLLGLFATPEAIAAAKMNSARRGVLEGEEMGRVFAWMRPNDLVWNYWVNNYLMGNPPPAFDILYWNNDTTRIPAKFHAQLLDIFTERLFRKPGAFDVLGVPIDLTKVTCDKYVVAGITDHITPWKGVYNAARLFGGKTDFVLSSSGHIQSLINPPGNPKAKFMRNSGLPESADNWLAEAREIKGSWWDEWREWIAARSGEKRPAPVSLGNERHKPGPKAPGAYVLEA